MNILEIVKLLAHPNKIKLIVQIFTLLYELINLVSQLDDDNEDDNNTDKKKEIK